MLPTLDEHLKLNNCPHCSVDYPNMVSQHEFNTSWDNGHESKKWGVFVCKRCGGAVLALSYPPDKQVVAVYPTTETADINLPKRVRYYLDEAMRSVSTPAGSVMLSASAVDAMLKEKGYKDGGLYARINQATKDGLLTAAMAIWAHQVRLEANGQRHADEEESMPTIVEAKLSVEFAKTPGDFLFVLPSRIERGINAVSKNEPIIAGQPKTLKLPPAYRSGQYSTPIILDDSESQPVVVAKFYYGRNGRLLPESLQPGELSVINRSGNPKWWIANLFIADCKSLPELAFVEILVDGQVRQAGHLNISRQTS